MKIRYPTCPTSRLQLVVSLLATSNALLLVLTGCVPKQPTSSDHPAAATGSSSEPITSSPISATFVGDAGCAPCHRSESSSHRVSNHSLTMHRMDRISLGKLSPPYGRVPDSDVILMPFRSGYQIMAAGQEDERMPLELALGSGHTGMTFVGFMDSETMMEVRTSYFPPRKRWYITPGHETQPKENVGLLYPSTAARKCMLCHAVTLPTGSLHPEARMFGVGCESCHGPGSEHVQAARTNNVTDLKVEKLGKWSATRLNEDVCGKCHRTEQSVAQQGRELDMTHRFQPYGLMKSRCFIESSRKLSCLTCHDPHTNTSRETPIYEAKCKSCHVPAAPNISPSARSAGGPRPCPVNPNSGCIQCHMPKRAVFPATNLPLRMADHFIRVHK